MKCVILQSNYFPWRGYFDLISKADVFVFYDEVKYTKNDWRNRNQVLSEKGVHWITIPISSDSVNKKISDVSLGYDLNWRKSHRSLLQFCYGKSPLYKKQLKPLTDHILLEKETNNLSELNKYIIKLISSEAGFSTKFLDSSDFVLHDGKVGRLIGLLKDVGATTYISGPAAKDYLSGEEDLFKEANLELKYYDYPNYPKYGVDRKGYHKYLSILDYLAHEKLGDIMYFLNS